MVSSSPVDRMAGSEMERIGYLRCPGGAVSDYQLVSSWLLTVVNASGEMQIVENTFKGADRHLSAM